jgi:hypothetical protein
MYVQTKTQTRLSIDVPFFDIRNNNLVSKEYRDYWRTTYVITNKCMFVQQTLSEDQLVLTSIMMWETKEDYNAFITDQYALDEFLNKFVEYNTANNIVFVITNEEEI